MKFSMLVSSLLTRLCKCSEKGLFGPNQIWCDLTLVKIKHNRWGSDIFWRGIKSQCLVMNQIYELHKVWMNLGPNKHSKERISLRVQPFIMTGKNSRSAWWWWKATSLVYKVSKVISQFLPHWAVRASSDERSAARLLYILCIRQNIYFSIAIKHYFR